MLIILAFAFVAGVLTILAPCTLPVVPLVFGAAATGGRRRTLGILVGFGLTFVLAAVVLAAALAAAGVTTDRLRFASALVLGLVGLTLVSSRIEGWAERGLAPVGGFGKRLADGRPGDGLIGGLVLGGAIGLIWAPCVGPIMAAVIATAVARGPSVETALIALAYVAGAMIPIAIIAGWGRRASKALGGFAQRRRLRGGLGVAMLVTAALVATGLDFAVEERVAGLLPARWGGALLAVEQQPNIQEELDVLRTTRTTPPAADAGNPAAGASSAADLPAPVAGSLPASVALEDLGSAPELTGIDAWINSDPLTMTSLRGKVVLVEFWTFGCINCQHVQPYVKAWYDRYVSEGLVVVGVHTPELSFERDLGNVRDAVAKADIRFPVAFDPAFATWNAYRNSYWPAFFFVDRSGRIRHTHVGEGDYDGSEQVIRELLSQSV
ncbi:MAG: redoxin family protein [Chloroflexota bacterium]|nr:redoxin family protein [Chloroflexota bacterium]